MNNSDKTRRLPLEGAVAEATEGVFVRILYVLIFISILATIALWLGKYGVIRKKVVIYCPKVRAPIEHAGEVYDIRSRRKKRCRYRPQCRATLEHIANTIRLQRVHRVE